MPTDPSDDTPPLDEGLLSPVTVGTDAAVTDTVVLDALVTAEVALARAVGRLSPTSSEASHEIDALSDALGWNGSGALCRGHGIGVSALASDAASGGNPVIPLVAELKERVPESARRWVHRGATSQDVVDTALMLVARNASREILASLSALESSLVAFAERETNRVAAARTLTQHAVPTTVGLRATNWIRGVRRAARRLGEASGQLPAQLGGAAGTLAAFVEHARLDATTERPESLVLRLPAVFADELGLATPDAPWHTTRWPVTELGDALVQTIDALGVIAADVATSSRTEIGELTEGSGGGSSAMPQKQNPVASVLIRSAALRAPQLGATLHLASAAAVDERPDGAWHAEWPTLRELLRLALGAAAHGATLAAGLRVDPDAVERNLSLTRGAILSERLSIVLTPRIGAARVKDLIAAAGRGEDLGALLRALPEVANLDVDTLLDPATYTGVATELARSALEPHETHQNNKNETETDR